MRVTLPQRLTLTVHWHEITTEYYPANTTSIRAPSERGLCGPWITGDGERSACGQAPRNAAVQARASAFRQVQHRVREQRKTWAIGRHEKAPPRWCTLQLY